VTSRGLALALALVALASVDGAAVAAKPEGGPKPLAPPPVGVTQRETSAASLVQAVLPGELLGVALPRVRSGARSGARRVILLAAPAGDRTGPRTVYELDLAARPPRLLTLREGLTPGVDALDAIDLESDGRQEVLLGEPGRLSVLEPLRAAVGEPAPRVLLERPGLDLRSPSAVRLRAPEAGRRTLVTAEPGRLRAFRVAGGGLAPLCQAALPLEAKREPRGLLLSTPPTQVLARDGDPFLVAVGPQSFGPDRLRTRLVELLPDAAGTCGESDAWSRLPGPEKVEQSFVLLVDGQPMLAVATTNAAKLGLFENLKLRIFRLTADRTRAGRRPSFAIETETKRWSRLELLVRDLDGDGHDDLVLVGPEGLKGKTLRVEAFLGTGEGRFSQRGLAATLDLQAAGWSFGADFDGNGLPDLVAASRGKLVLFTGIRPGRDGVLRDPPARELDLGAGREKPSVTVELGPEGVSSERAGAAELFAADLDGGGKSSTLVLTVSDQGRGVLRIVRWK